MQSANSRDICFLSFLTRRAHLRLPHTRVNVHLVTRAKNLILFKSDKKRGQKHWFPPGFCLSALISNAHIHPTERGGFLPAR